MEPGRLVILTALEAEAAAVAQALGIGRKRGAAETAFAIGDASGLLAVVGVGAVRLPAAAGGAVGHVLLAGLAGGLNPALRVGDVVVEGAVGGAELPYVRGTFAGSERLISTPADKAELFARTNASAVEMEGAVVRTWAAGLGAAFLHVRAISDAASDAVDPVVLTLVDRFGRLRPGRLAAVLATRPGLVPQLRRLGRDSKIALGALGRAVHAVVAYSAVSAGGGPMSSMSPASVAPSKSIRK